MTVRYISENPALRGAAENIDLSSQAREGNTGVDQGRRRFLIGGLTAGGGFLLGIPSVLLAQQNDVSAGRLVFSLRFSRTTG
jgi:hypothetical protein